MGSLKILVPYALTDIMSSITLGIMWLATMSLGRAEISMGHTVLSKIPWPNIWYIIDGPRLRVISALIGMGPLPLTNPQYLLPPHPILELRACSQTIAWGWNPHLLLCSSPKNKSYIWNGMPPSFIKFGWSTMCPTRAIHYGGMKELCEKHISKTM